MRDRYLYRAKRKNWRELPKEKWWVTGYLVNKKCGKYNTVRFEEFEAMIIVTSFSDGGIDWCYIDENTICQCTGLKDKNGKLIWENDIVKAWSQGTCAKGKIIHRIDGTWLMYPAWQNGEMWYLIPNENGETTVEVIGNIFDNPELLEVEHE